VAAVAAIAAAVVRKVRRLVSMAVLLWFYDTGIISSLAEIAALGKPAEAVSFRIARTLGKFSTVRMNGVW